jgi:hypothetical protein
MFPALGADSSPRIGSMIGRNQGWQAAQLQTCSSTPNTRRGLIAELLARVADVRASVPSIAEDALH